MEIKTNQQTGTLNLRRVLLCAILIVSMLLYTGAAFATEPTDEAAAAPAITLADDDVVATANGQPVTGKDVLSRYQDLVNYYGEPDPADTELYYAAAMEQAITFSLIEQTAAELGLDQFTQEDIDSVYATADNDWAQALDGYISYYFTFTDETTEQDKADANAQAEAYFADMGYTQESLRADYLQNAMYERVTKELCKDVTVTDEDVQAAYQAAVDNDRALYEFDIDAYETQMLMFQYGYADAMPTYHPEGYRYIKHILLPVDETLMTSYTDMLALYEEQQAADTAAEAADTEAADAETEPVVTAEDVDAAKAAIITSVQTEIDEINKALADGVSFEDLIAQYGADDGMTSGAYPDGYEVAAASLGFVPEFVAAAFSVDSIGDVSAPYISQYGVHIVKYIGDVPGGAVALTDDEAALIREDLQSTRDNDVLNAWYDTAAIEYTGILRPIDEVQADAAE